MKGIVKIFVAAIDLVRGIGRWINRIRQAAHAKRSKKVAHSGNSDDMHGILRDIAKDEEEGRH